MPALTPAHCAILRYLLRAAHTPRLATSKAAIARATSQKHSTTHNHVKRLIALGLVRVSGTGQPTLTALGLAQARRIVGEDYPLNH